MTMPDIAGGEEYQPAGVYEGDFTGAVRPVDVAPYACDHDADPAVCICVHDWRISWGNLPKRTGRKATYVTGV